MSIPQAFDVAHQHHQSGRLAEAEAIYRQILAVEPRHADALHYLGVIAHQVGRNDVAVDLIRRAIEVSPSLSAAHNNLGNALIDEGQVDEAIAAYRQAIALNPSFPEAHSNLLHTLHYHPGFDAWAIAKEHRRWNQQHAEPFRNQLQPHSNDRSSERRLRIGYVSPDFREHPVGRFLLPLLANHDRRGFEIFAYAEVPVPDAITHRLRTHTDGWRNLVGLSDAQAADLIRQDGVDILVDLAGHTANHRLLVFARKPAPVQVTCLGYPNTTGLRTIDYRLTDTHADPVGLTELHHSEQLIRLSPSAWCFQPTTNSPVTGRKEGPITFGCFNTFAKVSDPMLKLWGRILQTVPDSRLLLKSAGLGSATVRQRVQQILGDLGIVPERLELRGYEADHAAHLALYERMDIALDTCPYHGNTTTCEALWMGVPVVILAGKTHASRVGVSLLSNVGLPELIAGSPEEYVGIAGKLANDPPRLAQLRGTLRPRMEQSSLMDAPRFARDVEQAYRQMWSEWCAKHATAPAP